MNKSINSFALCFDANKLTNLEETYNKEIKIC